MQTSGNYRCSDASLETRFLISQNDSRSFSGWILFYVNKKLSPFRRRLQGTKRGKHVIGVGGYELGGDLTIWSHLKCFPGRKM